MANRNNKTDKTGRTFWDYSHENPKIVISLIVVLALLVVVLVFKDYSFKSPYISVAPKIKSDSIILDKKENIKPKEQEAQKGLTPNKAITKEQPKSSSKYDIKDNEFKGPTQIGDNNVQNIDTKQRVANDSIIKVITAGSGTALSHPGVHVFLLELPEAPNLVPRHALRGHPGVDGVFGYAEVVGDFIDREPAVVHVCIHTEMRRQNGGN